MGKAWKDLHNISNAAFIFVDMETTGLDPESDQILEIALSATDAEGSVVATYESLVDHLEDADSLTSYMDEVVEEMHIKSGLLEEWDRFHKVNMTNNPSGYYSKMHLEQVAEEAREFLYDCGFNHKSLPMAGNSVHFDRAFMKAAMPGLEEFFHYRNIDISTLRQLCKLLNPRVAEASEAVIASASSEHAWVAHRATDDLKMSIELYKFYKNNFLFVDKD